MAKLIKGRKYLYINSKEFIVPQCFLKEFICIEPNPREDTTGIFSDSFCFFPESVILLPEIGDRIKIVRKDTYPAMEEVLNKGSLRDRPLYDSLCLDSFRLDKQIFRFSSFEVENHMEYTVHIYHIPISNYPIFIIETNIHEKKTIYNIPIEAVQVLFHVEQLKEIEKAIEIKTIKSIRLKKRYYIEE